MRHPGTDVGTLKFPKHFYWGVAISGQQTESQQPSDWTTFEREVYLDRRFESGVDLGTTKPGHIRGLGRWSDTVRLSPMCVKCGWRSMRVAPMCRVNKRSDPFI
jgi:hypothetical protein